MKKLAPLIMGILLICGILYGTTTYMNQAQGYTVGNTLTLYNWGDYIDPALIKKFETETGYKVSYETFDSNEAMFTKIEQGGTSYDLTIPSEYMIQKMMDKNMLLPLDKSKIVGLEHINPAFLDLAFDPDNQYSIPYFWGTVGIVYNDKFVKEEEMLHWDDLWNPALKNNVMLVDGAREVIGFSLNSLGYSLNDRDPKHLAEVTEKLDALSPNVKAIVADEIKMYMAQEESAAAVTFSGEAAEMLAENEHLHYVVPEEGSNVWFDNFVIPKTAKNFDAAYAFINFMLRPENAAQNAEYVGYSTPNKDALQYLPDEVTADEQFYPSEETMAHLEVYENLGQQALELYNDLFLEFKMYRN
ncbi:ABC transporter substrate-binding protein [Isobaculum melis]|uniref:Spermidine/putrescine transport system substrate-binding protein n=1 Tax=Isobaculum melis TaxID=142588 RepID=A0A1H9PLZ6_9LACT|nr:ABC transporter substrate-binding protein [Isobaculum melis]SER49232.1 spermidine/putrescine transport system substrate-binding protein [Isobaculum melis]